MSILEKIETWRDKSGKAFGTIMQKIRRNSDDLNEISELTDFLNPHYAEIDISLQQRFYHIWFSYYDIERCPYCNSPREFSRYNIFSIDRFGGKQKTTANYYSTCRSIACDKRYNYGRTSLTLLKKYGTTNTMEIPGSMEKLKETNRKKYGSDFYMGTSDFKERTKKTFEEKYGGHPTTLQETQEKKKKTNLEKYGYGHALDNPEVKEKSRLTNIKKYGGNSSMCSKEIQEKSKETNRRKHGVDWYVQSEEFRKKFKEDMLEKYGVENALQYTPFYEKSLETSYRKKVFIFPSGRIEIIQGYEHFALCDLLDSGYQEEDIIVSNSEIGKLIGSIWYKDKSGQKRIYYPDIYIKSENKLIEVKSEYTYEAENSRNLRKKDACLSVGIFYEFWIYGGDGGKRILC
jgi:hypothetical protein